MRRALILLGAALYACAGCRRAPPAASDPAPAVGSGALDPELIDRTSFPDPWAARFIVQEGFSLRDDGAGPYEHRRASAVAIIGDAASLWTWRGTSPRDNALLQNADTAFAKRRFLQFDLRRPVSGSGAAALGLVRDSIARIHLFFREDSTAGRIVGIRQMPRGQEMPTDRVEFWIRAGGHQYLLQFGPWGMGKYSPRGAVNGAGTTPATVIRADSGTWVVHSPPNAIGRLWNVDNILRPSDAGLYSFTFAFRVEARH